MPARRPFLAGTFLLAAALLAVSAVPAMGAQDGPGQFTVLQAAYYSFDQPAPTNQSSNHRAVLLEQSSPGSGGLADFQHNASDALLENASRAALVMVEYQGPAASNPLAAASAAHRMPEYYRADLLPTTIIDGTRRIVAFADNSPETFANAVAAAATVPAGASITASGGTVLQNGYLDAEATATADVTGAHVFLRVVLVEDHVGSPADSRDLRFVARAWLGSLRVVDGHAAGRFNFTLDPAWEESRLGAVLFVQSDGPVEGTPPPAGAPGGDPIGVALLIWSPAIMAAVLGVMFVWLVRRERGRTR